MAAKPRTCGTCSHWDAVAGDGLGRCTRLPPRGPDPRDITRPPPETLLPAFAFPITPRELKGCGEHKR